MRWILALVGLLGLGIGIDNWIQRAPVELRVRVSSPGATAVRVDCLAHGSSATAEASLSGFASDTEAATFALPDWAVLLRVTLLNGPGEVHIKDLALHFPLSAHHLKLWELETNAHTSRRLSAQQHIIVRCEREAPLVQIKAHAYKMQLLRQESREALSSIAIPSSLLFCLLAIVSINRRKKEMNSNGRAAPLERAADEPLPIFEPTPFWTPSKALTTVGLLMVCHACFILILLDHYPIIYVPPFLFAGLGFSLMRRRIAARGRTISKIPPYTFLTCKAMRHERAILLLRCLFDLLIITMILALIATWILVGLMLTTPPIAAP